MQALIGFSTEEYFYKNGNWNVVVTKVPIRKSIYGPQSGKISQKNCASIPRIFRECRFFFLPWPKCNICSGRIVIFNAKEDQRYEIYYCFPYLQRMTAMKKLTRL